MMTDSKKKIEQVATHVINLFTGNQAKAPYLVYHNLMHTRNVVAQTNRIANFYDLSELEMFVVTAAAWFHDCGHLFGSAIDHEIRSVLKMREFMVNLGLEEAIIGDIESCILATRMPTKPKTLLDRILCDADVFHFGTGEFFLIDSLVKKEYELRNGFSPKNWDEETLRLLLDHNFYTMFCRRLLQEGKLKNIGMLQAKINHKN